MKDRTFPHHTLEIFAGVMCISVCLCVTSINVPGWLMFLCVCLCVLMIARFGFFTPCLRFVSLSPLLACKQDIQSKRSITNVAYCWNIISNQPLVHHTYTHTHRASAARPTCSLPSQYHIFTRIPSPFSISFSFPHHPNIKHHTHTCTHAHSPTAPP